MRNKFLQLILISLDSASWELHQYSRRMYGPMKNPKVETRSRDSNLGPHDCKADALPHDHGHHTHFRRRFQTATSSARQYGINKQTVLRRLRQARQPIRPRRPYVGQVLTARHRAARLQWTQRHFRWGRQQWAWVLFSYESRFNLSHHEFELLEEEGNVLLINVSLRGTDLEVGVLLL